MLPIDVRLTGRGFFPGATGLWNARPGQPSPPLPAGGLLVLGHNYDSEAAYKRYRGAGEEPIRKSSTWRWLLRLLDVAGIAPESCFFTNFFVGVIAGDKATGRFPGAGDPRFVDECLDLLRLQLQVVQPRAVACLGIQTPRFVARLAPALAPWSRARSLTQIDERGWARIAGVSVAGAPPFDVVALTHPSFAHANAWRRRYRGLEGTLAEAQLLREAMAAPSV